MMELEIHTEEQVEMTPELAEWYLREQQKDSAEIERYKQILSERIQGLQAKIKGRQDRYLAMLERWAYDQLPKDKEGLPKTKTLHTTEGDIKFTRRNRSLDVDISKAWCYALDEFPEIASIETIEREVFDKGAYLKKAEEALKDGVVLPGVTVVPERKSMSIPGVKKL